MILFQRNYWLDNSHKYSYGFITRLNNEKINTKYNMVHLLMDSNDG